MLDSNYIIVNREAMKFSKMVFADDKASFFSNLDSAVCEISIGESIYATLFCDDTRNVTFVIDRAQTQDIITVLFVENSKYIEFKNQLQNAYHLELSKQNIKINRYAESIAEKLASGVKLRVTDAADNSDMVECPECGMMNTKGSPYCMDCGADL